MTYYRTRYLFLISLLLGVIQLHPLYAQEEDIEATTRSEVRLLPDDIGDSFASTKSETGKADAGDKDAAEDGLAEDDTESDDVEVTESDIQTMMQRIEARKNQAKKAKLLNYRVVSRFPHRSEAFTQGLIVESNTLIESSGGYGKSLLSKVSLKDGEVLAEEKMPPHFFAEGVTRLGDSLYQLTYRIGVLMIYDADTLRFSGQHQYSGEGWGLTNNRKHLIMSDGSDTLKYMNPKDFKEIRRISVTENGRPLKYLNELEWVKGKIYANVWLRNKIVIINPRTGVVTSYLDLKELLDEVRSETKTGVLNGIAYDAQSEKLYVTGKNWPTLFEIEIELES